ncbi:TPA: hypothetical protein JA346_10825 [Legionella pneumophila]|nr:hypothetical protein D7242_14140 [Legionella pneumophila]RYW22580.1 hypothetical protein D7234_15205 [Legionella pneumophila]TIH00119.1 hypothetical protein DI135_12950 [Legionella pneumophila]HAT6364255.1 hypothetical protein [Legionella pneumophila]HAT6367575.1 hypothetical protein [Legionella pneumophila]
MTIKDNTNRGYFLYRPRCYMGFHCI